MTPETECTRVQKPEVEEEPILRAGGGGPRRGGPRADRRCAVLEKRPERERWLESVLLMAKAKCFIRRYQKLRLVLFLVRRVPHHWEPRRMKRSLHFP